MPVPSTKKHWVCQYMLLKDNTKHPAPHGPTFTNKPWSPALWIQAQKENKVPGQLKSSTSLNAALYKGADTPPCSESLVSPSPPRTQKCLEHDCLHLPTLY